MLFQSNIYNLQVVCAKYSGLFHVLVQENDCSGVGLLQTTPTESGGSHICQGKS